MYIDTHAHLFFPEFKEDVGDVIRRAEAAGVKYFIVPGTNIETSREAIRLAEQYHTIYAAVGIHPLDAIDGAEKDLEEIERLSEHPKVVAIGEIGLDYFYKTTVPEKQRELLGAQIEIAVRRNLPVIIHTRDSIDDALALIEKKTEEHEFWMSQQATANSRFPAWKGVFHCYSGDAASAWRLLDKGFLVSFPGPVTFKNSPSADVVKILGYDHLILETDAPFLTPVPFRGKRNEPSYIPLIAQRIAEICQADVSDVARTTSYNAQKLFGIGEMPPPVFTYKLGHSLYINLTIRCNADCLFCDRKGEAVVKGHNLKITREPTVAEVIAEIADPTRYQEIVFCGYGEPTIRFDAMKQIAAWVKSKGGKVRLNTDGHGNIINKRDITPELKGLIDSISISLNSTDPVQYGELMQLDGPRYFNAMIDFAREAKKHVPEIVMTIVGMKEVDSERAQKFVEEEIGVKYRVRPYF